MGKLLVKAGPNGPVPLPQPIQGARFIGSEPMEVPDERYFRVRLKAGDLVLAELVVQAVDDSTDKEE